MVNQVSEIQPDPSKLHQISWKAEASAESAGWAGLGWHVSSLKYESRPSSSS